MSKRTFENIYDAYCPMLYNIALQVCPTHTQANKILVITFKKLHRQKIEWMGKLVFCVDLIKLIIQTAKEELYPGEKECNFKIKQFENTPLLQKLMVEQLTLEEYCIENNLDRSVAISIIRNEFNLIRNTTQTKPFDADMNAFQLS